MEGKSNGESTKENLDQNLCDCLGRQADEAWCQAGEIKEQERFFRALCFEELPSGDHRLEQRLQESDQRLLARRAGVQEVKSNCSALATAGAEH